MEENYYTIIDATLFLFCDIICGKDKCRDKCFEHFVDIKKVADWVYSKHLLEEKYSNDNFLFYYSELIFCFPVVKKSDYSYIVYLIMQIFTFD